MTRFRRVLALCVIAGMPLVSSGAAHAATVGGGPGTEKRDTATRTGVLE